MQIQELSWKRTDISIICSSFIGLISYFLIPPFFEEKKTLLSPILRMASHNSHSENGNGNPGVHHHHHQPQLLLDDHRSISSSPSNRPDEEDPQDQEPDFLVWRRLQMSKAKLRGVTEMAALMAGFSVVATVELQMRRDTSEILVTSFSIVTALLVTATMLAIMIATCILPHLEAVSKMNSTALVRSSPHDKMQWYIDLSWVLANTLSIFLFIVDVILLCWIKFENNRPVIIAVISIMLPVLLLIIIFSLIFYRQSVKHQYTICNRKYEELEALNRMLNNASNSNNNSIARSCQSLQTL